jgi:hypothetical protein
VVPVVKTECTSFYSTHPIGVLSASEFVVIHGDKKFLGRESGCISEGDKIRLTYFVYNGEVLKYDTDYLFWANR